MTETRWRVTHVDQRGDRHLTVLECASSATALAVAEAMYGPARYAAAVRLPQHGGPASTPAATGGRP